MIPQPQPQPNPTEPPLLKLKTDPRPPRRRMQADDPLQWRLRRRVGQWLFWRLGTKHEPAVSPHGDGGLLLNWRLPRGSFRIHLSPDRRTAVVTHRLASVVFGAGRSNAALADVCGRLLAEGKQ